MWTRTTADLRGLKTLILFARIFHEPMFTDRMILSASLKGMNDKGDSGKPSLKIMEIGFAAGPTSPENGSYLPAPFHSASDPDRLPSLSRCRLPFHFCRDCRRRRGSCRESRA